VIDEATKAEERRAALEPVICAQPEMVRKDLFAEVLELYHQRGDVFGRAIPGMFVIASHQSLREPVSAGIMSDFLKNWISFRETDPDFHEYKSMGPFQWDDLVAFTNLLELSAMISREADPRLGINFDLALSAPDVSLSAVILI
jgi:hypothetical protein